MNKSLMAVRLFDETVIFAAAWKEDDGYFILEDTKCSRTDEQTLYIEDEIMISKDAIRVWFKVLRGDKNNTVVQDDPDEPESTPVV